MNLFRMKHKNFAREDIVAEKMSLEVESPIHDPLPMKIIFNLFLVLCHTAWLFWGRYHIDRLEWRRVVLNCRGVYILFQSRTASDTACELGITFADETKGSEVEKSCQSSCRRAKTVLVRENRQSRWFRMDENCSLWSSRQPAPFARLSVIG